VNWATEVGRLGDDRGRVDGIFLCSMLFSFFLPLWTNDGECGNCIITEFTSISLFFLVAYVVFLSDFDTASRGGCP
jgi:hypothetical protein